MAETHEVLNQPPPLEDCNLFERDLALVDALSREGGGWAVERARALGAVAGSRRIIDLARAANRHPPELRLFDRFGHRIDEVEYHPAYHALLGWAIAEALHALPWTAERSGAQAARAALYYLFNQAENGIACPVTMTYAAHPALLQQPEIAADWVPRIVSTTYDPTNRPAAEKAGVTIGMAMTEKQGGSDVRANTTRGRSLGTGGPGSEYALTGHKWFCSAPMSDAFLTLAHTEKGLSCFLVPRWRPDGTKNRIMIQRLKDKLGNRSNASSEIEYDGAWAQLLGEEGRGVPTIIRMVQHTRLDCVIGSAAIMRRALVEALHHAEHRMAFDRHLVDQPLMRVLLADLAIESEAAMTLTMRLARAYDGSDAAERSFARIATAIGKYWVCKRTPAVVTEAMECLGGNGYVEESVMPRLYREAPLNGIWEGSPNVICLDVLRAMEREPDSIEVLRAELGAARGTDRRYDRFVAAIDAAITGGEDQAGARQLVERLALALQGALLLRHAPPAIADAFCAARLDGDCGRAFGTLPRTVDTASILRRAWPP